jgi:hypothetical protein
MTLDERDRCVRGGYMDNEFYDSQLIHDAVEFLNGKLDEEIYMQQTCLLLATTELLVT